MATTPVEIFNAALDHLGVEPIVSFSEESKAARIGNRRYAPIRDKLLESHYWNFAEKREELAVVSSSPPVFGFDFKYQLPTDYIKAKHLNVKDSRFKVEQKRFLHTNLSGALLLYTAKITDVSAFSPMFTELLSLDIAIAVGMSLTQKRSLIADLRIERKEVVRDARSSDGQEGTNDELMSDIWINSRITDPTGDLLFDESI